MPNPPANTTIQDGSQNMSQWLGHVSLAKINVPRYDSCQNVYDFITAYEDATTTLLDDQKSALLIKAFPPDCQRTWYENELKPMIQVLKPWADIKEKIIDRFASQANGERHLTKLVELKFDPNGSRTLTDFIDDMVYSHNRAFPKSTDEKSCARFIKSALPIGVKASLATNPNYEEADDIEKLRKIAKIYDLANVTNKVDTGRGASNEMVKMIQDLVLTIREGFESNKKESEAIKKDNEETKKAIVAALQAKREEDYDGKYRDRRQSPQRSRYDGRRSPSPNFSRRSPSPRPRDRDNGYNSRFRNGYEDRNINNQDQNGRSKAGSAYDSKSYFTKFGVPPTPCPECDENSWHWARHCYKNLK